MTVKAHWLDADFTAHVNCLSVRHCVVMYNTLSVVCFRGRWYVTVKAHWLDADFTAHVNCLSVTALSGAELAELAATMLNDVINEWTLNRDNLLTVIVSGGDDTVHQALSKVYCSFSPVYYYRHELRTFSSKLRQQNHLFCRCLHICH